MANWPVCQCAPLIARSLIAIAGMEIPASRRGVRNQHDAWIASIDLINMIVTIDYISPSTMCPRNERLPGSVALDTRQPAAR